jgi:hypothetical protein
LFTSSNLLGPLLLCYISWYVILWLRMKYNIIYLILSVWYDWKSDLKHLNMTEGTLIWVQGKLWSMSECNLIVSECSLNPVALKLVATRLDSWMTWSPEFPESPVIQSHRTPQWISVNDLPEIQEFAWNLRNFRHTEIYWNLLKSLNLRYLRLFKAV